MSFPVVIDQISYHSNLVQELIQKLIDQPLWILVVNLPKLLSAIIVSKHNDEMEIAIITSCWNSGVISEKMG